MPFPDIDASLLSALSERGYAEPTPVQLAVLAPEALGNDLLVSAQTGSGKTVAFGLAMAPTLLQGATRFEPVDQPIALVIAPTRELALQVYRELEWLYSGIGARITSCVGGMDIRREQRALSSGTHIVVGTPGRLRDHIERGNFTTSQLRAVVLDEADEMLDLGFREDLEAILDATPETRRTLLFSATLPKEITGLAKRYQRSAVRIAASNADEPHGDIEYRAVQIAPHEAERVVVNILRFFEAPGALVFCSTREAVKRLHGNLLERGFAVVALSGELSQSERTHALQALRDGHARVCVATDVAARGLDLPDLGLVIQADLPRDGQVLLHRSGRTGRAGRKGICVLLVAYNRRRGTERMLDNANIPVQWFPPPSAEQVRLRDQERLLQEVAQADEPTEEDLAAARALIAERSPEELAAALVRLHRARLPAPEEVFDMGSARSDAPRRDSPREREPRGERGGDSRGGDSRGPREAYGDSTGAVLFRMNIGRNRNADPRWIIPVICRKGSVMKQDIGEIRILERETQFEIIAKSAEHFAARIRRPDTKDPEIRIELLEARHAGAERPERAERPPHRKEHGKDFAPKERGPRDQASNEQAPTDQAPREQQAVREQAPREHAPREYGPKKKFGGKGFGGPRGAKGFSGPSGAAGRIGKPKKNRNKEPQ